MSGLEERPRTDDTELAELVADIGERLQRGESVQPEDFEERADALRDLMPVIRMMAGLPAWEMPSPELGNLGDFRLIREVSRGGMGVVYEAFQVSLDRRVALKILHKAAMLDPRQLRRFRVEAKAAASLNHPHVVPVFATGSVGSVPYYAMRFIDGRDLAAVIRELRYDKRAASAAGGSRKPLTPAPLSIREGSFARDVARLAQQAAEALVHAHAHDVLHRDIKPSNVLIDKAGQLWITDFGLARILGGLDLTVTGDAPGTPRYMSPEQAIGGRAPLDGRTDIYSLGVTIYELLTLRPAFCGDDRLEILRQIAHEHPIPPRRLEPTIPVDLETIVLKAMAKVPADRYKTAADLAADLDRFLEYRPILARRPSLADQGAKWTLRHRRLVASLVGALSVIAVALALAGWHYTTLLRTHNAVLKAAADRADRYARKAERHAADADLHRARAEKQRNLADRHYLAAQLRLAQLAIEARQFEVAQDLLDEVAPNPGCSDPAEFAWRYLRRAARRELVQLPACAAQLQGMAVAGDGQTVAAWYTDDTITLWDVASELPLRTMGPVKCRNLALSDNGRILAAEEANLGDDLYTRITVWDLKEGCIIAQHAKDIAAQGRPSWVHLLAGGRVVGSQWQAADGTTSVRLHRIDVEPNASVAPPALKFDGLDDTCFVSGADFFLTRERGRVRSRDVLTGAIRRELSAAYDKGGHLAISGNGRYLANALEGDHVAVIDLVTGAERARYEMGEEAMAVVLSPDGNALAAVDGSGLVHVWDCVNGRAHVVTPDDLSGGRDGALPVFSPNGRTMATISHGNPGGAQPAAVWDVASGRRIGVMPSVDMRYVTLGFTSNNRSLITGGQRSPRIWHFDPQPVPASPAGHKDEAWGAAYSPDGKVLATGSDDTDEPQTIKLWEPDTGRLIRGWYGGVGTVASLAFSADGRTLASGHISRRENVRLWDVATGKLLQTLRGHQDAVRSIAFSPDSRTVASAGGSTGEGGQDLTIRVWDVAAAKLVRELKGHTAMIRSLAFSRAGQTLASAGNDQTIRLWDASTGRLMTTQRSHANFVALAFLSDGTKLAAADSTGMVTIRDAGSLLIEKTIRGESDELLKIAVAPDGRSVATCGMSGKICLWDTLTGQELLVLRGHKAQVNGIAFAPDGSSLTSCSHDGEVKLWRADTSNVGNVGK